MKISALIVEDDRNFIKLLDLRLKSWLSDIDISYANTLELANKLLSEKETGFDLVILDQHLPDGYGSKLFNHPALNKAAVLAMSADSSPEIPSTALRAGAQHFLSKRQISEPLFIPLLEALLERKALEMRILEDEIHKSKMKTIKVLISTLRHEINNPLGAVIGAAYILRESGSLQEEQSEVLTLIEQSGKRIKHVLNQLCEAVEIEEVKKGSEQVYQVPGDPNWKS